MFTRELLIPFFFAPGSWGRGWAGALVSNLDLDVLYIERGL